MKTKQHLLLLAAATLLTSGTQLIAQDKGAGTPASEDIKKPEGNAAAKDGDKPKGPQHDSPNSRRGPKPPEMKPTSFIGIMTRSPSPDVRAQVGLAEGFGLLVEEIMEDSPAKAAGIQQYDVLVLLGDQRLVNMEQLSALIRSSAKDSDAVFTLKRSGTEQKVTVKVGEKMMAIAPAGPKPWGEQIDKFGQQMRENAERLRQNVQGFTRGLQGQSNPGNSPRPHDNDNRRDDKRGPDNRDSNDRDVRPNNDRPGTHNPGANPGSNTPQGRDQKSTTSVEVQTSSSVNGEPKATISQRNLIRRDASGEYSLSEVNGKKMFTVKPTAGEPSTFEVTTDAQRDAMPKEMREMLDRVIDGSSSGVSL